MRLETIGAIAVTAAVMVAVTVAVTAGCAAGRPAPRFAMPAEVYAGDATVRIALEVAAASSPSARDRTGQYVGANSTTGSYNDISTLVVGLFDEGTTTAPGFGFKYSSAWGAAVDASAISALAGASWLADVQTRMGDVTNADETATRRYLVREFSSGLGSATAIAASFSKVPRGSSTHTYRAFAAAYDADGSNLGFTTASVANGSTSGNDNVAATRLTLTLNTNLYTGTLTQEATISNVYPEAL